jgi:hypothetical protein
MPANPIERLRRLCVALPGTYEKLSHGEPTFFAGKRSYAMFASAATHHGGGRDAVWCKAAAITQELLVAEDPERYFRPPYVGPSGWVGVWLDRGVDWKAVRARLEHAHGLALARPARKPKRA